MGVFVGKTLDLILNTRTIAGTDPLYATGKHGGVLETLAENFVYFERSTSNVATALGRNRLMLQIGKACHLLIALLFHQFGEVNGPAINTHRGTRLESLHLEPPFP